MKTGILTAIALGIALALTAHAQVPQTINYQGRVSVAGTNFDGTGQFEFALVNNTGSTNYWSSDGTAIGQPGTSVSLSVTKGLYSALLGDTNLANMAAIPATVFTNSDVRLRVWFSDGINGLQQLSPDQRLAAVGYALMAGNVSDGAITSNKIAAGAVTATAIANGAIIAANIATGAITSVTIASNTITAAQIAPGVVGAAQLAKPPQAGSIASSLLSVDFGNQCVFTASFNPVFNTTPNIILTLQTDDETVASRSALTVKSKVTDGFTGRWISTLPTPAPVRVTTNGGLTLLPQVGLQSSLAVVNGNPAICYHEALDLTHGNLKFVRAANPNGTAWGTPSRVVTNVNVWDTHSLTVVNGNPAVSYCDASVLKYIHAADVNGTMWGTPVVVDSNFCGGSESLAVVNGNPAITYMGDNASLYYVRATDASGDTWGTPVPVDSNSLVESTSLAVVNGNPAVSYQDYGHINLLFVRATDANGTAWGTPITVDTNAGTWTSLVMVNGNPAISYVDFIDWSHGNLKYVRAADPNGTVWGLPVRVDTNATYTSMAIISGNPAVSYSEPVGLVGGNLKYARAMDTSGISWGTPSRVDTNTTGLRISLVQADGNPAISYDVQNGDLKFIRGTNIPPFTINWIALEP